MDTLTFNSPILLRHLTFSEAKKMPISEIRLDKALEGLGMDMSQVRRGQLDDNLRLIWPHSSIVYRSLHLAGV